jgi:2-polyprenyl-3-methyl-5-hydroxy-6-metoxy-1,4-benzoquinol methylase
MFYQSQREDCPACNDQGSVFAFVKSDPVFKCNACGLLYLSRSLRQTFSSQRWYSDCREITDKKIKGFVKDMQLPYLKQLKKLERFTAGRQILDFGSGLGIFLYVAKNSGWLVGGFDVSKDAALLAKKNFDIEYSATLSEFSPGYFDVLRISQVLEHIDNPLSVLKELKNLIKPKGVLAVMVPNSDSLLTGFINTFRRLFFRKPRFSGPLYNQGHIIGFSPASLDRMIKSCGFKKISLYTVSMGSIYYPLFYDGLFSINPLSSITLASLFRFWLPQFLENLGNPIGKGSIIVGYYRNS